MAEQDELVKVVKGLLGAMQDEEHSGPMSEGEESKLRSLVRLGQATSGKRLLGQALSLHYRYITVTLPLHYHYITLTP